MCVCHCVRNEIVRTLSYDCALSTLALLLKPDFHGACFGAVSAPILSARVPRRASAAFEKNASTMNIAHVSMGQIAALTNVRADKICYPTR